MPKAVVNAEGRVHVIDDTGAPVTIEQADLPAALESGYQLESADSVRERMAIKSDRAFIFGARACPNAYWVCPSGKLVGTSCGIS